MRIEGWATGALRRLSPAVIEHFALDPAAAMVSDLGISVRAADHLASARNDGGACDGVSFLDDGVVFYAPSPHSKRQNFTLAHELGHWLVDHDDGLLGWLADLDDPAKVLETVCDAIAQRLLLPDDLIDSVVSEPIRAGDVMDLSDASAASRPVCAIAVASRIPKLGAVIIMDRRTRAIVSSTIHPDPEKGWPMVFPWRGDIVPDGHLLTTVAEGAQVTRRSFWRSRFDRREDFYIDAVGGRNNVLGVLSASDLWGVDPLAVQDLREWDDRPGSFIECCGRRRFVRGYPCPNCGRQFCPSCGSCGCTARQRNEGECSECHTLVGKHLLSSGKCELCA